IARSILGDFRSLTARTTLFHPAIKGEAVATILLDHENGATSVVYVSYATVLSRESFPETLIELDGSEGTIRRTQGD
ncbi:gfo/Idh/MocA family oxidoreductase, partial [Rhizobium ruizarguesonis]